MNSSRYRKLRAVIALLASGILGTGHLPAQAPTTFTVTPSTNALRAGAKYRRNGRHDRRNANSTWNDRSGRSVPGIFHRAVYKSGNKRFR